VPAAGLAERRAIEQWILKHGHGFAPVLPVPLHRENLTLLPLGADRDTGARRPFREALGTALGTIKGVAIGRYGEDRSIYDAETEQRVKDHSTFFFLSRT
jgi:hypothetical protein